MKTLLFTILYLFMLVGCHDKPFNDVGIFKGTNVEELSRYVESEDTLAIKRYLLNNHIDIDTPDLKYGTSLLMWSISNGKYHSFKILLENGANPNYIDKQGSTPLYFAVTYIDSNYRTDDRYIKLLIRKGANPYLITNDSINHTKHDPISLSPLHLDYLRVFIEECNVDVNYERDGRSIVETAIIHEKLDELYYLVVEHGAFIDSNARGEVNKWKLIEDIEGWQYEKDSEEDKMRNDIVNCYYIQHPEEKLKKP